jgi:hypothetical protein
MPHGTAEDRQQIYSSFKIKEISREITEDRQQISSPLKIKEMSHGIMSK